MIYSITYDLNKPGQDYPGLFDAIKGLGSSWWHYLDSFWLVDTSQRAQDISEMIKSKTDATDHWLVIRVDRDYQGWLPEKAWQWIQQRI